MHGVGACQRSVCQLKARFISKGTYKGSVVPRLYHYYKGTVEPQRHRNTAKLGFNKNGTVVKRVSVQMSRKARLKMWGETTLLADRGRLYHRDTRVIQKAKELVTWKFALA